MTRRELKKSSEILQDPLVLGKKVMWNVDIFGTNSPIILNG